MVLDCFAGCAYVAVAAEREDRDWLACDINPRAWTVFKRQFSKPKLASLTCAEPTHNAQPALIGDIVTVHGPDELPTRTTTNHDDAPPAFQLQAKPRTFKTPDSIIPESKMLELLLELSEVPGLVLRLRQPTARRQRGADAGQLPLGSPEPGEQGRRQPPDHQPRPAVSLSQHREKQPAAAPCRVP